MSWTLSQIQAMSDEEACARLGVAAGHLVVEDWNGNPIAYNAAWPWSEWQRKIRCWLGLDPWPSWWPVYAGLPLRMAAHNSLGLPFDPNQPWRESVNAALYAYDTAQN